MHGHRSGGVYWVASVRTAARRRMRGCRRHAFIPIIRVRSRKRISPTPAIIPILLHEIDLRRDRLDSLVEGVDVIFHLAAMAGLPKS